MPAVEVKRKVSPSVVRGCASFLSATCSAEKSALFTFVLAILPIFSFLSCCGWAVEKMFCMHPVRQPIMGQVMWRAGFGCWALAAEAVLR